MGRIIKDTFEITKKDLKEFTRDRLRLVTFFIMPIFMMILVGFIFPNQNSLKNIPLGIAIDDQGKIGERLNKVFGELKGENDVKIFEMKKYKGLDEIKDGIKKQEINGGIFIPGDFSKNISENKQTDIVIIQDQSNPQISALEIGRAHV